MVHIKLFCYVMFKHTIPKNNFYILIAILLYGSTSHSFSNDEIGNATLGLKYALRNCSSCHAVQMRDAQSGNPKSVPFNKIAELPGLSRTSLSVFLQTPHPTMPNLIVQGEDADNIIAYILSLRGTNNHKSH